MLQFTSSYFAFGCRGSPGALTKLVLYSNKSQTEFKEILLTIVKNINETFTTELEKHYQKQMKDYIRSFEFMTNLRILERIYNDINKVSSYKLLTEMSGGVH